MRIRDKQAKATVFEQQLLSDMSLQRIGIAPFYFDHPRQSLCLPEPRKTKTLGRFSDAQE
jgi:hypothetical protein